MNGAVLLVDSERATLEVIEQEIRRRLGYRTFAATGCSEALQLARFHNFRLAVIDIDLPDGKGYQLIPSLKRIQPGLHVIVTSSDYSEETERISRTCGLALYMTKPLDLELLEAALRTAWNNSEKLGSTGKTSVPGMAGALA